MKQQVPTGKEAKPDMDVLTAYRTKSYEFCESQLNTLLKFSTSEAFKVQHNLLLITLFFNTERAQYEPEALLKELEKLAKSREADTEVILFNQAVLFFRTQRFAEAFKVLNNLLAKHERLDPILLLQVCILAIDVVVEGTAPLGTSPPLDIKAEGERINAEPLRFDEDVTVGILTVSADFDRFVLKVFRVLDETMALLRLKELRDHPLLPPNDYFSFTSGPASVKFHLIILLTKVKFLFSRHVIAEAIPLLDNILSLIQQITPPSPSSPSLDTSSHHQQQILLSVQIIILQALLYRQYKRPEQSMAALNHAYVELERLRMGEDEQGAVEDLKKRIMNDIGVLQMEQGKHTLALYYFDRALNMENRYIETYKGHLDLQQLIAPVLHYNIGLCHLFCGHYEAAYAHLSSTALRYYNRPLVWLRMAECCIQQHKKLLETERKTNPPVIVVKGFVHEAQVEKAILPTASRPSGLPLSAPTPFQSLFSLIDTPALPSDPALCFRPAALPAALSLSSAYTCLSHALELLSSPSSLRSQVLLRMAYVCLETADLHTCIEHSKALLQDRSADPTTRVTASVYLREAMLLVSSPEDLSSVLPESEVFQMLTYVTEDTRRLFFVNMAVSKVKAKDYAVAQTIIDRYLRASGGWEVMLLETYLHVVQGKRREAIEVLWKARNPACKVKIV